MLTPVQSRPRPEMEAERTPAVAETAPCTPAAMMERCLPTKEDLQSPPHQSIPSFRELEAKYRNLIGAAACCDALLPPRHFPDALSLARHVTYSVPWPLIVVRKPWASCRCMDHPHRVSNNACYVLNLTASPAEEFNSGFAKDLEEDKSAL